MNFTTTGKLIRQQKTPSRAGLNIGDYVRVTGLEPGMVYLGQVVSTRPLRAKVVQPDQIWEGHIVGWRRIETIGRG